MVLVLDIETESEKGNEMRTLTNMTMATLMALGLMAGCDDSGVEQERVLFNLTRDEAPARIVIPGDESNDGCTVVDILPQDGLALLKNLCVDDKKVVSVQLSDELATAFAQAVEMERVDIAGRIVEVQTVGGETFDVPMTVDLEEALEQVEELAEELETSGKPELVQKDEPAPEQTAVAMAVDTGYVFGTDSLFDAMPTKVDIVAHQGVVGIDLAPGVDGATMQVRRLHVFANEHGTPVLFNDLHQLPNYELTDGDADSIRNVRSGMGFVIENNVSGGYTYVFVKQASMTKVELEYQAVQ